MGYKKTRKNHRKSVRRKRIRRIIIVILGFAHLDSEACTLRLQTGVNEFFRHPSALLLTTGGYTTDLNEGQYLASRAIALGVPTNRILVEDQAKNTIENAQLTYRLLARRFPANARTSSIWIGLFISSENWLRKTARLFHCLHRMATRRSSLAKRVYHCRNG